MTPPIVPRRWACAVLALAGLAGTAVAAAPDIDAEWRDFLATADAKSVYDAYQEAAEPADGDGNVDPQACRDHADGLAKAVELIPVSAAVHYTAYRCAEALGDDAAAERHAERFAAIARHALASASDDWKDRPIRVVGGNDIYAILRAGGLELRYEILDGFSHRRHLTTRVATWDDEAGRERHFAFDYLDVVIALNRDEPRAAYPLYRREYTRAVVRNLAQNNAMMGVDMVAINEASGLTDPKERAARLRPAVESGGLQSATVWLDICRRHPFEGCGEGLVDALLPMVENQWGLPTVLLALAYGDGIGVPKDEAAAMQLLDKAGRIMGQRRAVVAYAREFQGSKYRPYPDVLRAKLDQLAAEGDPYPSVLYAGTSLVLTGDGNLPDPLLDALRPHAAKGVTSAVRLLGGILFDQRRHEEAAPLLLRAAEAGDASAQDLYARLLYDGAGVATDRSAAIRWWRLAAAGGDDGAMHSLGLIAIQDKDWLLAQEWLRNSAAFGNEEAARELAELYVDGHEGLDGDGKRAVAILEEQDSPDARQLLASFYVEGRGVEKDPAKALPLLQQDAERDDRFSSMLLGMGWLRGDFGKVDETEGMRWLAKGLEAGDAYTVDAYAMHLYYQKADAASRAQALALWRKHHASDNDSDVGNNLAWVLCTSSHDEFRKPAEGLAVARTMGKPEDLHSSAVDTIAACHAANEAFAEAERLQALAIRKLEQADAADDSLPAMRDRLALFRKRQPYIEIEKAP